jgi:hypothetical protein
MPVSMRVPTMRAAARQATREAQSKLAITTTPTAAFNTIRSIHMTRARTSYRPRCSRPWEPRPPSRRLGGFRRSSRAAPWLVRPGQGTSLLCRMRLGRHTTTFINACTTVSRSTARTLTPRPRSRASIPCRDRAGPRHSSHLHS